MRKKQKNPFKMWGSYVGFLLFAFINIKIGNVKEGFISSLFEIGNITLENAVVLILSLLISISGFLIGWGIHSLVRKYK